MIKAVLATEPEELGSGTVDPPGKTSFRDNRPPQTTQETLCISHVSNLLSYQGWAHARRFTASSNGTFSRFSGAMHQGTPLQRCKKLPGRIHWLQQHFLQWWGSFLVHPKHERAQPVLLSPWATWYSHFCFLDQKWKSTSNLHARQNHMLVEFCPLGEPKTENKDGEKTHKTQGSRIPRIPGSTKETFQQHFWRQVSVLRPHDLELHLKKHPDRPKPTLRIQPWQSFPGRLRT